MLDQGSAAPDPRPATSDSSPSNLIDDVQESLEHLYDYVFLQNQPLSTIVGERVDGWHRGASLHRLLVETIDRLKPPRGTPPHSPLWRRYRHAFIRYIESETVAQIAEELGVSERQARRDNHEAVEAIAELIRQRLGKALDAYPRAGAAQMSMPRSGESRGVGLDKEVERIAAIGPHGPTRLDDVVQGALATISNLARAKEIVFEVQMPPVAPLVSTERTAIRQIVLSLLVGAIDLAETGSWMLISVDSGASQVTVTVSARLSSERTPDVIAGFESRLAIAKKLAGRQGVTLFDEQKSGEVRVSLAAPAVRQMTVLIVDDNPGMLRLLKRYLSGSDYSVIEAGSPEECIRLAEEAQPDVITLDVMMPEKDGWEVLQTLRALPRTLHIPVVVCSVLKEEELARSLGASVFLPKPITQEALLRALNALRPSAAH